jgi:hypothetical protein
VDILLQKVILMTLDAVENDPIEWNVVPLLTNDNVSGNCEG